MRTDSFEQFACGSNGGPPRQALAGWKDFHKCPPEPSSLREVYARFDSRLQYQALAKDDEALASRLGGTRVGGHAVVLSVLFDEEGIARGIRVVTDPRAPTRERRTAHMLRMRVMAQYGSDDWQCEDFPALPEESPVGGLYVKNRCEKASEGRFLAVEGRFFRKAGQTGIDPTTGELKEGDFESSTRFEILDPAYSSEHH